MVIGSARSLGRTYKLSEPPEPAESGVVVLPAGCGTYAGGMFGLLVILLLAVPILELFLIIQVAGGIGTWWTIWLLIVISVVGAWLVRHEGLSVLGRVRSQLAQGRMPTVELVDGLLILLAGAFMLTPGFLTDGLGLLLLLPPTRMVVRTMLIRYFGKRIQIHSG